MALRKEEEIQIELQLRDGQWGRTLRSRKGLVPLFKIFVTRNDNFSLLVERIRSALPKSFFWDIEKEPIRYQRVKEQTQSSLQAISPCDDFFQIFKDIKARKKHDGDFIIHLWIYGTWIVDSNKLLHGAHQTYLNTSDETIETSTILSNMKSRPLSNSIVSSDETLISEAVRKPKLHNILPSPESEYLTLNVKLNGITVPLEVEKKSLRSLLDEL